MTNEEGLKALGDYFQLMSMNGATRIFATAKATGIFQCLATGAKSPAGVAQACSTQDRPTRLLLEALEAIGLVASEGDNFSLSPLMQMLTGTYSNLSDEYWDHLPTLLKTGEPIARMDNAEESEAQYAKQVQALAWMMKPAASTMAKLLDVGRSRKDLRILDVGAGSAIWSLSLAGHDSGTTVTAIDWPAVLAIASQFAAQHGLAERFNTLPGNFHDVALPAESYDTAIVANVTHLESEQGLLALFKSLHDALAPGGEIVVIDVMPGQPQGDLSRTLYALGLALRTEHGTVHKPEVLQRLLSESGYQSPDFQGIPAMPHTMGMIVAKKSS